ncbi:MAG: bifunctional riboflavin kinase/FAD synthetase [Chloroflexi bacterium]|nr:bifunctional riboflavin kinase/FAD synthetase [Chloroflexota bacterium]MDA1146417.1 bifunctional riboflavin kinase/FAD synthetase [Chloroflexota bacterium]
MLLVRQELQASVTPGAHALSIGVFDGVHRGHQMLIARMLEEARSRGLGGGVVTFHPHPLTVVRPDVKISYLESLERRVELLRGLGLDFVSVLQFTSELQQVSALDFCRLLVEEARMGLLVVGEDFRLGRGGEGTVAVLTAIGEQLGFEVLPIPLLGDGDDRVSSTRVREALAAGEMESVSDLLGHPFLLRGPVLHGDERGRQIGFPTLNVGVSADRWLPPNGVYVTRAHVGDRELHACTNIGVRPTFEGEPKRLVETHLLDFEGDLYGDVVTVELLHRLRSEQKFDGIDALRAQIDRDLVATREWFA